MEYFDIIDENGLPTGETVERTEAHRLGLRHRTAHVWIARRLEEKWQVLLQKRSACKDAYPGCLDTSSAGHIQAGDEPLESALRELHEELGIAAKPDDLTFIGMFSMRFERMFHGSLFRDDELTSVFLYTQPVNIDALTLQAEEIESVGWYDLYETAEAVKRGDPACCVTWDGLRVLMNALGLPPRALTNR